MVMPSWIKLFSHKLIFITIFLFLCSQGYSQEYTDLKVKTALIYKFTKYITWNTPSTSESFIIGIYGNNPKMLEIINELEGQKVKNRRIKIIPFAKVEEIVRTDILYVNYESNFDVKKIYRIVKNNSTLLVTDRYENKREVMINFFHNVDNKVQFELNSKNLDEENLTISPKLLLLGGTELDVRELYKKTEKSLLDEKEKSEKITKELNDKKREVDYLTFKISVLYKNIDSLNKTIDEQVISINKNNEDIQNLKQYLSILKQETEYQKLYLDSASKALKKKSTENIKLDSLLMTKQSEIEHTIESLAQLSNEIAIKEKVLNQQSIKIESQRKGIIIFALFVIALAILLVNIYRIYKIKKNRNIELEKRNIQINKQKEKIEKQAAQLKITNLELEKLSIVAEKTDNAVVIMNELGNIEWVNEGFVRMFGYTLEEFIIKTGNNFISASTSLDPEEIMRNCIVKKNPISYESFIITKSKQKKWLQSTITPIVEKDGKVSKLVAIDTDISIIKKAEDKIINKNIEINEKAEELRMHTERLKKVNQELEFQKKKVENALEKLKNTQTQLVASEKMASLGQLTSGIAHEINNPINYISSSMEGLRLLIDDVKHLLFEYDSLSLMNYKNKIGEIKDLKTQIEYNEIIPGFDELTANIKMGIDRTKEIVNSLHTFSRIDDSNYSIVDINESIDSTIILLGKHHKERVKIVKDYGELPKVECIAGKMNQVYLNILVNALQAINKDGIIKINTSLISKNNIPYAKLQFIDNGRGMSEEIKGKIFEPFYTTKDVGKGTGLGLSITYSVIQKHNGIINVTSKPGKGTTFEILLPITQQKQKK